MGTNKGGTPASVLMSLKLRHGKEDPKYYPVCKAGENGGIWCGEVGRKWLPYSGVLQNFSAAEKEPFHSYHLLERLATEWWFFFNIKFSNKNCKTEMDQAQDLSFYRLGENFAPFYGSFWTSQNKTVNFVYGDDSLTSSFLWYRNLPCQCEPACATRLRNHHDNTLNKPLQTIAWKPTILYLKL